MIRLSYLWRVMLQAGHSSRFDRMYFRSAAPIVGPHRDAGLGDQPEQASHQVAVWEMEYMLMLGTEAVFTAPNGTPIFPSDHFGLVATLAIRYST